LFWVGKVIVDKNLWYEYTDQELRGRFAVIPTIMEGLDDDEAMIDVESSIRLMMNIGIPHEYCCCEIAPEGVVVPFLTQSTLEKIMAKIDKEVPEVESKAIAAQAQAEQYLAQAKADIVNVRDEKAEAGVRNAAKAKVIDAAAQVAQTNEAVRARSGIVGWLNVIAGINRRLGGLDLPYERIRVLCNIFLKIAEAQEAAEKLVTEAAKFK
jgi:hypothetical protein